LNYRERLDIIADILGVANPRAKKTKIMYQANLSYKILLKYLGELIEASLLEFENEQQFYMLTQKGQDFLQVYEKYSRTNKSIEPYLDNIRTTKKRLEDLCSSNQL